MKAYFYLPFLLIGSSLFLSNNSLAQVKINFSHERGFYYDGFNLNINTTGDNIKLKYTLDGSEPSKEYGISPNNVSSFNILGLNRSTVVRVFAYNEDESISATQTYLFVDDVFNQNNNTVINELVYPSEWGYGTSLLGVVECRRQNANYDVTIDDCITSNPNYEQQLLDGLMQIPTMAISLDKQQIFGADSGLYVYPVEQSDDCYTLPENVDSWIRKASVEILNDVKGNKFSSAQAYGGLKISGYSSRYLDFYKHSFQLKFDEKYGDKELNYPLYGKNGADSFKNLELRMIAHCSPHDWTNSRREESQFHKDSWTRTLQKQLSGENTSANSKFFHLFINGLYWGIYDVCEKIDADYMADYYGGESADYDIINFDGVESGNDIDYKLMYDLGHAIYDTILTNPVVNPITGETIYNEEVVANENKAINFYNEIENLLDIENFIDYNLLNLYLVNTDWSDNNWRAARNRDNGKFQFFVWDAEFVLNDVGKSNQVLLYAGATGDRYKYNPIDLNQRLFDVPAYKIKFGDKIQCHCVEEDGVLNPENLAASYKVAEENIRNSVMLEFARWANVRKDDLNYQPICFDVVEKTAQDYEERIFPNLLNEMLILYGRPEGKFKLFPNYIKRVRRDGEYVFEEIFNFKAVQFAQLGGEVEEGYELTLTNPNNLGDIYYTTDGTDPRNVDGTIATGAIKYEAPIIINEQAEVKARVFAETFIYEDIGEKIIDNLWSAMCPRKFYMPGEAPDEEMPVSINAYTNTNINVFPKPVKNQLNITGLPAQSGNILSVLKVFSINGQVMVEEEVTATSAILNTNNLPNGHYIITVSNNKQVIFTDKIIKME